MSGTTAPMIGAEISHLMSEFSGRSIHLEYRVMSCLISRRKVGGVDVASNRYSILVPFQGAVRHSSPNHRMPSIMTRDRF